MAGIVGTVSDFVQKGPKFIIQYGLLMKFWVNNSQIIKEKFDVYLLWPYGEKLFCNSSPVYCSRFYGTYLNTYIINMYRLKMSLTVHTVIILTHENGLSKHKKSVFSLSEHINLCILFLK